MKLIKSIQKESRKLLHKLPPYRHANAKTVDVPLDDPMAIAPLLYWAEHKPFLRINVPVELLTMEGAFAYAVETNPFVAMLVHGEEALRTHYDHFQPATICEKYSIKPQGLKGEEMPLNTLPWIMSASGKVSQGEWGLGPEHGISYHGPVTDEKYHLEIKRLNLARESIEKKGYLPERHGDIQGYFLRHGDQFRFSVRGGKHRAAVLVARGDDKIPVRMKPGWPRCIDRSTLNDWPEVANGNMDPKLALAIFDAYFQRRVLSEL